MLVLIGLLVDLQLVSFCLGVLAVAVAAGGVCLVACALSICGCLVRWFVLLVLVLIVVVIRVVVLVL